MNKTMLNEEMLDQVNGGCYIEDPLIPVGDPKDSPIYKELTDKYIKPGEKLVDRDTINKILKEIYNDVKIEPLCVNA